MLATPCWRRSGSTPGAQRSRLRLGGRCNEWREQNPLVGDIGQRTSRSPPVVRRSTPRRVSRGPPQDRRVHIRSAAYFILQFAETRVDRAPSLRTLFAASREVSKNSGNPAHSTRGRRHGDRVGPTPFGFPLRTGCRRSRAWKIVRFQGLAVEAFKTQLPAISGRIHDGYCRNSLTGTLLSEFCFRLL